MRLYKLINGLGEYYVIANDPTEAEQKLKTVLDAGNGYGFERKRKVTGIDIIADEITKDGSVMFPYDMTDNFLLIKT